MFIELGMPSNHLNLCQPLLILPSIFPSIRVFSNESAVIKASADDGIPAEVFQILKDDANKVLHSICQQIWKTREWPQDWKRSIFIPIPSKGSNKECSNYQTIALIIHGRITAPSGDDTGDSPSKERQVSVKARRGHFCKEFHDAEGFFFCLFSPTFVVLEGNKKF